MPTASREPPISSARTRFRIRFPRSNRELDQDEEWFEFHFDGRIRKLRIHDYDRLYRVPGLYESLVYGELECKSPQRLTELLVTVLADWPANLSDLRVLDLGAGNGIVAEELCKIGVRHVVGLDILPEARLAARRDRPTVYGDYLVTDLCNPSEPELNRLADHRLDCLITVAALGFGDIPPDAFATAFNLIATKGWLGVTIKEDFLESDNDGDFARLFKAMIDLNVIEIQAHHRYCHRLSITGGKLFYVAVVARKMRDIPASLLDELDSCSAIKGNGKHSGHAAMLLGR